MSRQDIQRLCKESKAIEVATFRVGFTIAIKRTRAKLFFLRIFLLLFLPLFTVLQVTCALSVKTFKTWMWAAHGYFNKVEVL